MEQDTIRLLRECDAGIKMGVTSINDVLPNVHSATLRGRLETGREDHEDLQLEVQTLLKTYGEEGKDPNPMAKGMSKMKTGVKMAVNETDFTAADLITDGCNMGVKTLSRYLNQYPAANEQSKEITRRLIRVEEQMAVDMRAFL